MLFKMTDPELKRTPLYDLHLELNARVVPFAGYAMPVQYPAGIKQEHLHTRAQAGLFDVSHMGQVLVSGDNAAQALEKLIPVDLEALENNHQTYAVFTNENGGILDDLIICRWSKDTFFLVVNAACKEQDLQHLQQGLPGLNIQFLGGHSLLALQGPKAKLVMKKIAPASQTLSFMTSSTFVIEGIECHISRSGYTGEDGFEISVPDSQADRLARLLLSFDEVEAIGLGARDTLRLEAGLCLYGHDMDTDISPVEAALVWSISKSRRSGGNKAGGFLGANKILEQMIKGVAQQRVGLLIEGRRLLREGVEIFDEQNKPVGRVTSGGFSPTLEAPIAMAYVNTTHLGEDCNLHALVRDKTVPVSVVKMPFVPQQYFRA
jgi:aminomethyltransferase